MKEKLKKMTNAELIARRDELKGIGENPESRSVEELEQLAEERNLIEEELTERRAAAARDSCAGTASLPDPSAQTCWPVSRNPRSSGTTALTVPNTAPRG